MSGANSVPAPAAESNMLATLMAPKAPHLLQRSDEQNAISVSSPQQGAHPNLMAASNRPKLSLMTTNITPKLSGNSNGSKSVADTAATPTTFNTFTNSFDLTFRPSPVTAGPSPLSRKSAAPSSPLTKSGDDPYNLNLPFGVRPILKNTPLPRQYRRSSVCSTTSSPYPTTRKVFFPAPKKVSFRVNLEDEIMNKDFVARHSDLSSSEDESGSSDSDESIRVSQEEAGDNDAVHADERSDELSPSGKRKRHSALDTAETEESDRGRETMSRSSSTRRGKRKKRRWEWTLGPLRDFEARPLKEMARGSRAEIPDSAVSMTPVEKEESKDGSALPPSSISSSVQMSTES